MNASKQPRRQHFVPQFYLRRFSNVKDQVGVYVCATGARRKSSIANEAVESHLYSVATDDGSRLYEVETALAQVDDRASTAMKRITLESFPPSSEDRFHLSLFMAVQMVRTREFRHLVDELGDVYAKSWFADLTIEQVRARLREQHGREPEDAEIDRILSFREHLDDFTFIPPAGVTLAEMLRLGLAMAPEIFARSWYLFRSAKPRLITSDHPVVLLRVSWSARRTAEHIGLATADWVFFSVDPHNALGIGRRSPGSVLLLDAREVSDLNNATAAVAYETVYFHPDHPEPLYDLGSPRRRALVRLNGVDVPRGGLWKALEAQRRR